MVIAEFAGELEGLTGVEDGFVRVLGASVGVGEGVEHTRGFGVDDAEGALEHGDGDFEIAGFDLAAGHLEKREAVVGVEVEGGLEFLDGALFEAELGEHGAQIEVAVRGARVDFGGGEEGVGGGAGIAALGLEDAPVVVQLLEPRRDLQRPAVVALGVFVAAKESERADEVGVGEREVGVLVDGFLVEGCGLLDVAQTFEAAALFEQPPGVAAELLDFAHDGVVDGRLGSPKALGHAK